MSHSKEAIELAFAVLRQQVDENRAFDMWGIGERSAVVAERDELREKLAASERERDELREKLELEEKKVKHWNKLWNAAENELTGVRMELSGLKASGQWAVTCDGMNMLNAAETARNLNLHRRAAREPVYYTVPVADTNKD